MVLTDKNMTLLTTSIKDTISLNVWNNVDKVMFIKKNIDKVISKLTGGKCQKLSALKGQINNLSKRKEYKRVSFGMEHGLGRLRPVPYKSGHRDSSYVDITRPVRHFLLEGHAYDIDIVNAHHAFIENIYKYFYGKEFEDLKYWNDNRKQIFESITTASTIKLTRDDIKQLGFVFLYDGSVDYRFQELGLGTTNEKKEFTLNNPDMQPIYDLVSRLRESCLEISQKIKDKYPDFWDCLGYRKVERQDIGKFSSFLQHIESLCVLEIHKVAQLLKLRLIDFCNDGVLVLSHDVSDREIQKLCSLSVETIETNLGLFIQIIQKAICTVDDLETMYKENPEPQRGSVEMFKSELDQSFERLVKKDRFEIEIDKSESWKTEVSQLQTKWIDYKCERELAELYFHTYWIKIKMLWYKIHPSTGRMENEQDAEGFTQSDMRILLSGTVFKESFDCKKYDSLYFGPIPDGHNYYPVFLPNYPLGRNPLNQDELDKIDIALSHFKNIWCAGNQDHFDYLCRLLGLKLRFHLMFGDGPSSLLSTEHPDVESLVHYKLCFLSFLGRHLSVHLTISK